MAQDSYLDSRPGGLFRLLPSQRIAAITGNDAWRFLQGQVTQDVLGMAPGEGRATAFCDPTGHVLGEGYVLSDGDSALVCASDLAIFERLDGLLFMDDAAINILNLTCTAIVRDADPEGRWTRNKDEIVVSYDRTGFGGVDVWSHGVQSNGGLDESGWRALRYERGMPEYGIDVTAKTIANEAGERYMNRRASLTKGCYVGQEVLMRIYSRGRTQRELAHIAIEGRELPPDGAPIASRDRDDAGWITGCALTPLGARGMGYVRRDYWDGAELTAIWGNSSCKVSIISSG
ncbi:MAG: hypothetical protein HUU60_11475 [Armatimonadetes bacterium]|nr:hypothetical protein [Armatimonadota bacterium]